MPTVKPRVNVTLSPSLDLLVTRLAATREVSKSQVLRELLEAAEPALQRVVMLMEAASTANDDVLTNLARSLTESQDKVEATLSSAMDAMDSATSDLVRQAEEVRGRRPGRRGGTPRAQAVAGGLPPVPVTRGVGSPPGGSKGSRRGRL